MAEKFDKQDYQVGKCHCKMPVLALGFEGGKHERRGPFFPVSLITQSSTSTVPSPSCYIVIIHLVVFSLTPGKSTCRALIFSGLTQA